LAEWRAWFKKPRNQIAFSDYYDLPSLLRRRTLVPRFVLVHGRRAETGEDPARLSKRHELLREDERLMTFDRLAPNYKSAELLCIRHDAHGYHLKYAPPAFQVFDGDDDRYAAIDDWEAGLRSTPDLAAGRADFVLSEVEKLRRTYRDQNDRAKNRNPR
jgi:hypothetical protein